MKAEAREHRVMNVRLVAQLVVAMQSVQNSAVKEGSCVQ